MECIMECGSFAADEYHCPDCGWSIPDDDEMTEPSDDGMDEKAF